MQRQILVSILLWNAQGYPEVRSAKFQTWQYITQFDIVTLAESQSSALCGRQLSGYMVFTISATSLDKACEGVLLAIRQQLPFSISHWQANQANTTMWLTFKSLSVPAAASHHLGLLHTPRL